MNRDDLRERAAQVMDELKTSVREQFNHHALEIVLGVGKNPAGDPHLFIYIYNNENYDQDIPEDAPAYAEKKARDLIPGVSASARASTKPRPF
jgi:hypothetical protein